MSEVLTHTVEAIRPVPSYTVGIEVEVYVQVLKGEGGVAMFRVNNHEGSPGYRTYKDMDALKKDFKVK